MTISKAALDELETTLADCFAMPEGSMAQRARIVLVKTMLFENATDLIAAARENERLLEEIKLLRDNNYIQDAF